MDTQRPAIHKPFWHGGFLRIIIANLLVCTSLYMLLPLWTESFTGEGGENGGMCIAAAMLFCAGLCLPAPFCNYWLDAYRRKRVAQWALAGFALTAALMPADMPLWGRLLLRLFHGSTYSVFQIALGSTLLLDLSDTRHRTEAAHIYYWFSRLALIFGPLLSWLVAYGHAPRLFTAMSVLLPAAAWVLVSTLAVPFRAPLNPVLFSLDRFWLPRGLRIFVPVFLVTSFVGMFMAEVRYGESCLFVGAGFLAALIAHQSLFKDNMQEEIISGFCMLLLSCACLLFRGGWILSVMAASVFLGAGAGAVTGRFLLSYIRICEHCERGTAQTSYWLGWETGLVAGFTVPFALPSGHPYADIGISGIVVASAGLFYLFFVRKWYIAHKRK